MDLAVITAQQVAELFILIGLGALGAKTGLLRPEGKQTLSNLLVNLVVLHDKRPLFFIYSLWAVHSGTRPHLVQVYHICRQKATKRHNFSGFPFLLEKVP